MLRAEKSLLRCCWLYAEQCCTQLRVCACICVTATFMYAIEYAVHICVTSCRDHCRLVCPGCSQSQAWTWLDSSYPGQQCFRMRNNARLHMGDAHSHNDVLGLGPAHMLSCISRDLELLWIALLLSPLTSVVQLHVQARHNDARSILHCCFDMLTDIRCICVLPP